MKIKIAHAQAMISVITAFCLFAGYVLQYIVKLLPCPLCLMQRWCMMGILIVSVFLLLKDTPKRRLFQAGFVLAGLFFAGRQVWLQSLPPEMVPACMPGLDILMTYFSWADVAKALIWGGGDCAKVTYRILGLSLATWSLIYFVGVASALLVTYGKKK